MAKTGGIYMDWDVVTLRPLTPLLHSGFAFVAGRQYGGAEESGQINGTLNNGAFMAKPNSAVVRLMVREQMAAFNGRWEFSLKLLTAIAERLVSVPYEVLICDRNSFAPTHWFPSSTDRLFLPNDDPSPEPTNFQINSTDPMVLYDAISQNWRRRKDWEMDFSSTYLLHAFGQGHMNQHITPQRILARTSNYGIATWAISRRWLKKVM